MVEVRRPASTIIGSLPPSSSTEPFSWRAHSSPTLRPASTEPVKNTFATLEATSAGPVPGPWIDPHQPLGDARALEHLTDPLADQRRQRGRLEHDSVAGHQRQRDLAERDAPRVVPRRDHPDHPERLVRERRALGLQEQLRHRDLLVGEDLEPGAGDPAQRVDRRQDLHRERLVARLALLADDQVADLVGLVDQHLGGALEVARAVGERQLRPERLHLGDGPDDRVDRVGRGDRDRAEPLAGRRVERLEPGGCHRHGLAPPRAPDLARAARAAPPRRRRARRTARRSPRRASAPGRDVPGAPVRVVVVAVAARRGPQVRRGRLGAAVADVLAGRDHRALGGIRLRARATGRSRPARARTGTRAARRARPRRGRGGDDQRLRVGVADVLRGEHDHPPDDEPRDPRRPRASPPGSRARRRDPSRAWP